jgi:hypothetical protein
MFKDRIVLTIVLVAVVLALGFSAWFYWGRPAPSFDASVACKWNANELNGKPDTCAGQCASIYVVKGLAVINGKEIHACCPKGYSPTVMNNPITNLADDIICVKDGK